MGGTSTDVCLIAGGVPAPAPSREVGGFPVRLPALDIHTIGAGGGSIAAHRRRWRARESGRAPPVPIPARRATAWVAASRPSPMPTSCSGTSRRAAPLPGLGILDVEAAQAALDRAGTSAEGVVAVVDAAMAQAVRKVTVERGVDPRELALVAFGGAGPMHACALADLVGISTVIVPARAGVLCAVGLLGAPVQHDVVRSVVGGRRPRSRARPRWSPPPARWSTERATSRS